MQKYQEFHDNIYNNFNKFDKPPKKITASSDARRYKSILELKKILQNIVNYSVPEFLMLKLVQMLVTEN